MLPITSERGWPRLCATRNRFESPLTAKLQSLIAVYQYLHRSIRHRLQRCRSQAWAVPLTLQVRV